MKLYHNNAKSRYSPLQRKASHKTPARVNCQALVFVRIRCYHAARAGYADRDDARQDRSARTGTRDAPAVPGQIAPELGRFAVGGAAAP